MSSSVKRVALNRRRTYELWLRASSSVVTTTEHSPGVARSELCYLGSLDIGEHQVHTDMQALSERRGPRAAYPLSRYC